ncbi:MAG: hypothetical protein IAE80_14570 [Anaerolinea sp.]|nr:hypothetical protein [Anaerolinea sp.]
MGQVDINEYNALRVRVAELEAQVAFLMRHLNVQYVSPDGEFMDKLKKLAQSGKLLEAIKLYREKTGASLEEAKRYFGV